MSTPSKQQGKSFGLWLRKCRETRGLSQSDLARLAEVSRAYISRLENDSHVPSGRPLKPSVEVLQALARALMVSDAEVMYAAGILDAEPERSDFADRMAELFAKLSPETQEAIFSFIQALLLEYLEGAKVDASGIEPEAMLQRKGVVRRDTKRLRS